jgi:predicted NACHT family NTPase
MMMAPDSSPPPSSRLDDELVNALRLALRANGNDAEHASALQGALLLVATEARARDILPEQLLVRLKEAWSSLPEVRAMRDAQQQARLLERVVTMCIREYYNA